MLYPEYKHHEIAYIYGFEKGRALFSRNKFVLGKNIKEYYGKTDYFVSVARYNEDLTEHIKNSEKGKIAGFDGSIWYDFIVLDLDEKDPRKVALFLDHLEINYGIEIGICRIYFSGSKGFHILVPTPIFGLVPGNNLHNTVKELVKKIASNILKYDESLYDKGQVYRLPHTVHSKTGLYKIPLEFKELDMGINHIRQLATKRRDDFIYPEYPTIATRELAELVSVEEHRKKQDNLADHINAINTDGLPPSRKLCILHILKGVTEGSRDETAIRLASHFKKEKYPFNVVLGLLHGWNYYNNPPLTDEEIKAKVVNVFRSDKIDYGCNDHILAGHCDPNCYLFRR